ncbi:MAG: class I SAM-dependent rRNA methyltransferase [Leptospirales bacterium]|nr:class I SAM-dependent rRNA methyltransferase [Leptospirales bacterium]
MNPKRSPIILKAGREKSLKHRHPLVFSGAIETWPEFQDGDLLTVRSKGGDYQGCGYFRRNASLAGRMLWFADTSETTEFTPWVKEAIHKAAVMRLRLSFEGNAWRMVHGESDNLPGLTVDRYATVLVMQIASLGMELQKKSIVDGLVHAMKETGLELTGILQKPCPPASAEPGTLTQAEWLYGNPIESIKINENHLTFNVDLVAPQKTGFFLDQRENRALIRQMSRGKRVLNCFSFTGAFSVNAASGGATRVDSVDSSERAIENASLNFRLNNLPEEAHGFHRADVFEFLRSAKIEADLIILDPPAFARSKRDLPQAMRGYRDIHRLALQRITPGGLLLTSSCSHPVDEALLQKIIFQASLEARRNVKIIQKHRQGPDHPISIYYPEGEYIKGFLLYVE